jgi:serine/threonine protein kinase
MKVPEPQAGEVIYIAKGDFLGKGATAILERLPSGEVIKTPTPNPFFPNQEEDCRQNMCLEAQIYERIGEHPRVPKLIKWDPDECCLTMEYLENGNLGDYVEKNYETIAPELRLRWAKQASEGLQVLHSIGVIHCDISPRNFLLDCDLNLKISDFAGSSLSGSETSTYADTRFRHPCDLETPPRFSDDIFGLGSLIYFLMTNNYPYEEVPSDEVEKLYGSRQFPEVTHLMCGDIIERCWHQQVDAAQLCDYFKHMDD